MWTGYKYSWRKMDWVEFNAPPDSIGHFGRGLHSQSLGRKMEAAAQDRAGWRQVVCGLCSNGSDKAYVKVIYSPLPDSLIAH